MVYDQTTQMSGTNGGHIVQVMTYSTPEADVTNDTDIQGIAALFDEGNVSAAATASVSVANILGVLSWLPVYANAASKNLSLLSYLHKWTRLSKTTLTAGKLDQMQQSTKDRIARHQRGMLQTTHGGDPEALKAIAELLDNLPQTRFGSVAILKTWMCEFAFLTRTDLAISKAVSLEIDELLEALSAECRAQNLQRFRQTLLHHYDHHGVDIRLGDEPLMQPLKTEDRQRIERASTWEQMIKVTEVVVELLLVDLLATLDAEWGAQFFASFEPIALFPLVMVKPRDGLLDTLNVSNKRNMIKRPSRRLLELLYALAYYTKKGSWPPNAPLPVEIAEVCEKPGMQELADPNLISSYFDGTTALTLDVIESQWKMMLRQFHGTAGERASPDYAYPFVVAVIALLWQRVALQNKPRSFFLMDTTVYDDIWKHRRQQWERTPAASAVRTQLKGQARRELVSWPAWLIAQLSPPG